jgi:hypothetical protein
MGFSLPSTHPAALAQLAAGLHAAGLHTAGLHAAAAAAAAAAAGGNNPSSMLSPAYSHPNLQSFAVPPYVSSMGIPNVVSNTVYPMSNSLYTSTSSITPLPNPKEDTNKEELESKSASIEAANGSRPSARSTANKSGKNVTRYGAPSSVKGITEENIQNLSAKMLSGSESSTTADPSTPVPHVASTPSPPTSPNARPAASSTLIAGSLPPPPTGATPAGTSQASMTLAKNVPQFLLKLFNMVGEPSSDQLIHWSSSGNSFIVEDHEELARSVLPNFFKHSNFSSFVRQLNMYAFYKVPHISQGSLAGGAAAAERWEFMNEYFLKGQPDLLCMITRKKSAHHPPIFSGATPSTTSIATTSSIPASIDVSNEIQPSMNVVGTSLSTSSASTEITTVISELSAVRKHQLTLSSEQKEIQAHVQLLWRDLIATKDLMQRQQETIDKILRFLAVLYSAKDKAGSGTPGSTNGPPTSGAVTSKGKGSSADINIIEELLVARPRLALEYPSGNDSYAGPAVDKTRGSDHELSPQNDVTGIADIVQLPDSPVTPPATSRMDGALERLVSPGPLDGADVSLCDELELDASVRGRLKSTLSNSSVCNEPLRSSAEQLSRLSSHASRIQGELETLHNDMERVSDSVAVHFDLGDLDFDAFLMSGADGGDSIENISLTNASDPFNSASLESSSTSPTSCFQNPFASPELNQIPLIVPDAKLLPSNETILDSSPSQYPGNGDSSDVTGAPYPPSKRAKTSGSQGISGTTQADQMSPTGESAKAIVKRTHQDTFGSEGSVFPNNYSSSTEMAFNPENHIPSFTPGGLNSLVDPSASISSAPPMNEMFNIIQQHSANSNPSHPNTGPMIQIPLAALATDPALAHRLFMLGNNTPFLANSSPVPSQTPSLGMLQSGNVYGKAMSPFSQPSASTAMPFPNVPSSPADFSTFLQYESESEPDLGNSQLQSSPN